MDMHLKNLWEKSKPKEYISDFKCEISDTVKLSGKLYICKYIYIHIICKTGRKVRGERERREGVREGGRKKEGKERKKRCHQLILYRKY